MPQRRLTRCSTVSRCFFGVANRVVEAAASMRSHSIISDSSSSSVEALVACGLHHALGAELLRVLDVLLDLASALHLHRPFPDRLVGKSYRSVRTEVFIRGRSEKLKTLVSRLAPWKPVEGFCVEDVLPPSGGAVRLLGCRIVAWCCVFE
jgi:hypothetical protein